ncbi:copper chaperone CopZ [Pseudogracilibacillus sp. ICA-222130]|uniref:copper chaperone CopZ n=1 Tax=Pseudogracilibacillus sp. ICA-222130 TaxID=3134655 RepID=UPI0030BE8098
MAVTLKVEGMSCGHCEKAVKGALGNVKGVEDVQVDLAAKTVKVEYDEENVTIPQLAEVIEDQGYDVVE